MTTIIEVVFENVPRKHLISLFENFCGQNVSDSILSNMDTHHFYTTTVLKFEGDGFSLREVLIRAIKYDAIFDLEISFDLNQQVELSDVMLCTYFVKIAHLYQIPQVYGGLEPAEDEETRFFTGASLGPMNLQNLVF